MLRIPNTKSVKHTGTIRTPAGEIRTLEVRFNNQWLTVCVSRDVEGDLTWEHVSVTPRQKDREPTYKEMNFIKQLFWEPEDEVMHFFPPASEHVNLHKNCLHLWRPTGVKLPWGGINNDAHEQKRKSPAY